MQLDRHAGRIFIDFEVAAALPGHEGGVLLLWPVWLVGLSHALLSLVVEPARIAVDVERLDPFLGLAFDLIGATPSMRLILPLVPVEGGHLFIVLDGKIRRSDAPAVHKSK